MPAAASSAVSSALAPPRLPQARRFCLVAAHEWRVLRREVLAWLAVGVFALLVAWALANGLLHTQRRETGAQAQVQADQQARAAQQAQLQRILAGTEIGTPFGNPANPANVGSYLGAQVAVLPSLALAPVALGQSDLLPSALRVSLASKANFIEGRELDNPWHAASGHFDLAFVIVYLLPLLICALGYNLLAGEREDGSLKLLLSQPLAFGTLILAKLAVRAGVLLGVAVLLPLAALALARPQVLANLDVTLWWLALVALYALFWCALVVFVNLLDTRAAANAMILVVAWVLLVLVVPVLINLGIALASPAPSRAELASRTRVVTAQAMQQNAALLATDYHQDHSHPPHPPHPPHHQHAEQTAPAPLPAGRIEIAARPLANVRIAQAVDAAMAEDLARFDAHRLRQHALLARASLLSPALAAASGMAALAGTDVPRHARYMASIDAHHQAWRAFFVPRVEAGLAISPADFAELPVFRWQELPAAALKAPARRAAGQLALPVALLLALIAWRIRRYRVV